MARISFVSLRRPSKDRKEWGVSGWTGRWGWLQTRARARPWMALYKAVGNYSKCDWETTDGIWAGNMFCPFVTWNALWMFFIVILLLITEEAVWGSISLLGCPRKPAIQFHICRLEAQRQKGLHQDAQQVFVIADWAWAELADFVG